MQKLTIISSLKFQWGLTIGSGEHFSNFKFTIYASYINYFKKFMFVCISTILLCKLTHCMLTFQQEEDWSLSDRILAPKVVFLYGPLLNICKIKFKNKVHTL